jgi:cytochrome c
MASFNTVAGCVLASALFAMVVGKVSNAVVNPHHLEKPALAVADEAPTETAAAPAEELPPIGPLLAGANVEAGKAIFIKQCFTCHTIDKGAPNKIGPNQWDLVGRKKASEEGFSYSSGLKAMTGEWTYEDINHMIFKPQSFVKGTKMAFAGLPKEQDRADIIAYLRTMNDNPPPLPAAAPADAKPADAKPADAKPADAKPADKK